MDTGSTTDSYRSAATQQRVFPIAPEGYPFILGSAFVTVIVAVLGLYGLTVFFLAVTSFVAFFFRDPERAVPQQQDALVSPADGKVLEVGLSPGSDESGEEILKIGIFMSVFSVHVNRMPEGGKVTKVTYYPGRFFSANLDKASKDNERNAVTLETITGHKLTVVQVAGLIARRIVCRIQEGDHLSRGQRFGLIRFGSRVDVYLPKETVPAVSVGDKVSAGSSILGHLS